MKISRYRVWAGVLLALVATAGAVALLRPADPFGASQIRNPAFPSLTYSIQVFGWWDTGKFGFQMDTVNMLGFNTIKQTFAWRDLEPIRGRWDFTQGDRILYEAERRNIRVVARLGQVPEWAAAASVLSDEDHDTPPDRMEDWVNYCRTVAERYRGRIVGYQIWNEPNLSREWGNQQPDAAGYTRLLAACSAAIRAADPAARIISAGLAPTGTNDATATPDDLFLDAMYRAGFQRYVDAVGVHAPGFSPPHYGPDDAERDGRGRWATFRRVEDLRKIMLRHGDGARQMAILEMGYTTDPVNEDFRWFAVTEEQRERYMIAAYTFIAENWRPWVGLVSAIYLQKPGWDHADEEYWWSLSTFDRYHTPALMAMMRMPKFCDDYVVPEGRKNATEEEYIGIVRACP